MDLSYGIPIHCGMMNLTYSSFLIFVDLTRGDETRRDKIETHNGAQLGIIPAKEVGAEDPGL